MIFLLYLLNHLLTYLLTSLVRYTFSWSFLTVGILIWDWMNFKYLEPGLMFSGHYTYRRMHRRCSWCLVFTAASTLLLLYADLYNFSVLVNRHSEHGGHLKLTRSSTSIFPSWCPWRFMKLDIPLAVEEVKFCLYKKRSSPHIGMGWWKRDCVPENVRPRGSLQVFNMSSLRSRCCGYTSATVKAGAVLTEPYVAYFCLNQNLVVHGRIFVSRDFCPVLFSMHVVVGSCKMEPDWSASRPRLPYLLHT